MSQNNNFTLSSIRDFMYRVYGWMGASLALSGAVAWGVATSPAILNVLFKHSFKNVLIPVITLIGLDIPSLLSGAIVVESIFAWPGMGRLFWNSAQNTDIPPLMGLLMFVAVLTVLSSLIADILYAAVDPRIRYS